MRESDVNAFSSAVLSLLKADTVEEFCEAASTHAKLLAHADEGFVLLTKSTKKDSGVNLSVLKIPLVAGDEAVGTLVLSARQKDHFTKADRVLLTEYGQIVSLLLQKLMLLEKTKDLLKKREVYIAHTSHELRNPLTSINGYIEMLYTKRKKDTSSQTRWIEEVHEECLRFTDLVKRLLDIEQIRKQD